MIFPWHDRLPILQIRDVHYDQVTHTVIIPQLREEEKYTTLTNYIYVSVYCIYLCVCFYCTVYACESAYLFWTECKDKHRLLRRSEQASLWIDAEGVVSGGVMLDA